MKAVENMTEYPFFCGQCGDLLKEADLQDGLHVDCPNVVGSTRPQTLAPRDTFVSYIEQQWPQFKRAGSLGALVLFEDGKGSWFIADRDDPSRVVKSEFRRGPTDD